MKIHQSVQFIAMTVVALMATTNNVDAQAYDQANEDDYQDYADGYAQQDNLYADYAAKQEKGAVAPAKGGGMALIKSVIIGSASFFVGGKFHSGRTIKFMKKKHMKDQKTLYAQYYNDVYKLQQQNSELSYMVDQYKAAITKVEEEKQLETVQRDYDEFKQPDVDGDDRISRAEFNMYVKNYLANYPGLDEKDYPKFEDFDHDGDGFIGFQEYGQQMALTVQQAEKEKSKKLI